MKYIDLRSDTVTEPTLSMRKAMFKAEFGDDIYGDDPTVNQLERYLAELVGKEDDVHYPSTGLICLENAHSNGRIISLENMKEIYKIAKDENLPVHLNGARLFNAASYLNVEPTELTRYCDSVMFCISKGLCAPIGSILAGDKKFIDKAIKKRKLMGGSLRQAGILAAAGLVALKDMRGRLNEDHKAKKIASKSSLAIFFI